MDGMWNLTSKNKPTCIREKSLLSAFLFADLFFVSIQDKVVLAHGKTNIVNLESKQQN